MLIIRWKSGPSKGWVDLFPSAWFEREHNWQEYEHLVKGPMGGNYSARCSGNVSGQCAEIAYGGMHANYNAPHHFIGTLRISFTSADRTSIDIVEWRDDDHMANFHHEDVDIFDVIMPLEDVDQFNPSSIADGRRKIERLVVLRQGQKKFRKSLLESYEGRCAISGCNVQQVLEAAHIMPYLGEETNHVENGLLLRADLHTLFDLGKIKIDAQYRIIAPDQIIDTFNLPESLGEFLPKNDAYHPSRAALAQKFALEPDW